MVRFSKTHLQYYANPTNYSRNPDERTFVYENLEAAISYFEPSK